eukprot:2352033-Rhodomonas_salina.2
MERGSGDNLTVPLYPTVLRMSYAVARYRGITLLAVRLSSPTYALSAHYNRHIRQPSAAVGTRRWRRTESFKMVAVACLRWNSNQGLRLACQCAAGLLSGPKSNTRNHTRGSNCTEKVVSCH